MPPHAVQTEKEWNVGGSEPKGAIARKDTTGSPRPKKAVSFQDTVTFRGICPLEHFTKEEIRTIWYSDDEYAKIKKTVSSTVKKAEKGDVINESKGLTMRGLEGRTKFGARRRKNNKAAALDAVWTTQIELWRKKSDQPLAIATAYRTHSVHAKYRALESAHADETYVNDHVRTKE